MPAEGIGRKDAARAADLGGRMVRLGPGWMGVGFAPESPFGSAWAEAAQKGLCRAGGNVVQLGELSYPCFRFGIAAAGCRGGIYAEGRTRPVLHRLGERGMPLTRQEEALLRQPVGERVVTQPGRQEQLPGLWELYCSRLKQLAGGSLQGRQCILRCANPWLQRQAREVLAGLGCSLLQGPVLWLDNSGRRLTAILPDGRMVPHARLVLRACGIWLGQNRAVALPTGLAPTAEQLGRVLRYAPQPASLDPPQLAARELAATQLWEQDGLMLAVLLLAHRQPDGPPQEKHAGLWS